MMKTRCMLESIFLHWIEALEPLGKLGSRTTRLLERMLLTVPLNHVLECMMRKTM